MFDCIFCKIVKGEIPCYKIYEDEEFLAFLDIFPNSTGHTLVIPKEHVEWVWDCPNLGKYFEVVGKIARNHRKVNGEGVRSLVFGWEIPHAHVHLMPGKKDNLKGEKLAGDEMEKIRKRFLL
ncbi:MAG: HIT domain-containing protein [Candidatus Beckwithbacteria bacterium]|nr:HIT domain-containing protein [Patescibacteria group bacterium]